MDNNNEDISLVNKIKNYIDANYDDKMISLESIADSLNFSMGYLSRIFKKRTGITIAEHIHNLRIQKACHLLSNTNIPVKDIISKIGYNDHSNFTRSFKLQTGFTPSEYRNIKKLSIIIQDNDA